MSKENDKLIKQFQDYLNYERNYSKNTVSSYLNDLKEAKDFLKKMEALTAGIKSKAVMLKFFYKV